MLTHTSCRVIVALFVFVSAVLAAHPQRVDDGATLDAVALRVQTRLDAVRERALENDEPFPGGTAAFMLPDGQCRGIATGFSDVEQKVSMTADLRMPSGSVGKMYVAAVALSLANDGVFALDDPISKWLGDEPWFPRLPNADAITIRMLLNHSSGLIDHVFDDRYQAYVRQLLADEGLRTNAIDLQKIIGFVLDQDPLFPAGEGFSYTDTGYILAGMVIERASGSTYYKQLRKRILEPASLDRTEPQNKRRFSKLAQGYADVSSELFGLPVRIVQDGALVFDPSMEWTGGGLVNNPRDMVRFAKALFEGELIAGEYLDALLGSAVPASSKERGQAGAYQLGYSLGVRINKIDGRVTYGHSGFFPGYTSCLAYYPAYGIAVALQINSDAAKPAAYMPALADVVIGYVDDQGE